MVSKLLSLGRGRIRDVEYGHAEYVLYTKYHKTANIVIIGILISN